MTIPRPLDVEEAEVSLEWPGSGTSPGVEAGTPLSSADTTESLSWSPVDKISSGRPSIVIVGISVNGEIGVARSSGVLDALSSMIEGGDGLTTQYRPFGGGGGGEDGYAVPVGKGNSLSGVDKLCSGGLQRASSELKAGVIGTECALTGDSSTLCIDVSILGSIGKAWMPSCDLAVCGIVGLVSETLLMRGGKDAGLRAALSGGLSRKPLSSTCSIPL